jgi:hypothetical protein
MRRDRQGVRVFLGRRFRLPVLFDRARKARPSGSSGLRGAGNFACSRLSSGPYFTSNLTISVAPFKAALKTYEPGFNTTSRVKFNCAAAGSFSSK